LYALATIGAFAQNSGTLLQLLIVRVTITVIGAALTHFGAGDGGMNIQPAASTGIFGGGLAQGRRI